MAKHSFAKFFLSIWIALFAFLSSAQAAEKCTNVFLDTTVKPRGVNFGLRSESEKQPATPIELINFKKTQSELYTLSAKMKKGRPKAIEHLLAAVEFFDYTHTASKIISNFLDGKKESLDFTNLYDRNEDGGPGAPFKGFLDARDNYLRKEKPPVNAELLSTIHTRIMSGGVEGVAKSELGVWRNGHWLGNVAGSFRMTPKEVETVVSNPYLVFEESMRSNDTASDNLWRNIKIWGSKKDMAIQPTDNTLVSGRIHYPFVKTPKQETVDLIKDTHPAVYATVMKFRKEDGTSLRGSAPAELEQAFAKALIENRFSRFNAERAELGTIVIGKNEHKFIDLVADLQRDLVAIHPVLNGNGRTTRLLMNYLLTREGLPAVRLVDPFLDVQVSQKEWREYVHKGIVNDAQLHEDMLFRLKNGLTLEYSPELLYPGLPEAIKISLKKQGSVKEVKDYADTKIDSDQFNAFFKTLIQAHPELRQEIENNRLRTMSRIADLFVEYYRSKTIRYIHDKDGEREIALRMVDPDFMDLFAVNRSGSKEQWDAKINRWYDSDMLVWRGLSNKRYVPSRQELLDYFRKPTTHLVSNSVSRAVQSGTPLVTAIKEDFNKYNQEMLSGDMIGMAIDHHRSGPRYSNSYGYSTSKREVVGKAFAMGAMVVGEYGKQKDPALQATLKSRVNVASYRSTKDVDLGRLKAFDQEFSYTYGRQAEVMGIGGVDPDAVMLVQTIDAKGNVMETLLRNADKPSEILVIEGRYVPGEGPLPTDKIKERLTIR